jgi:hypothetical protein
MDTIHRAPPARPAQHANRPEGAKEIGASVTEPKPANDDHLPQAVAESEMDILGMKFKCYVLDDGRRVFDQETLKQALKLLGVSE